MPGEREGERGRESEREGGRNNPKRNTYPVGSHSWDREAAGVGAKGARKERNEEEEEGERFDVFAPNDAFLIEE